MGGCPKLGGMSTQTAGAIPEWTIADRLRKAREVTGMDQRQFADRSGISRNTVSNYETGKTTRFSRPMLAAWSMATGVPLAWLETGAGSPSGRPVQPTGWQVPTRQLALVA